MMGSVKMKTVAMVDTECGGCGIDFSMPEWFYRARHEDGKTFYCPAGCPRAYRESDVGEEISHYIPEHYEASEGAFMGIVAEWAKDAAAVVDAAKAVDHAWRFVNGTGARMAVPLANLSAAVDALEATELVGDGIGTALPPAVEGCICSHTVHMDVPGAPVELNADADCPVHGEKAYHG